MTETVIRFGDEQLSDAAEELRSRITTDVAGSVSSVVIDFTGSGFFDSVGIGSLIHARNCCLDADVPLVLRGMSEPMQRLLSMTGLDGLFRHELDLAATDMLLPAALPASTPLPSAPDPKLDQLASLTKRALKVPVALVSLVDQDAQVFPGAVGLPSPWQEERSTPLTHSFCQYVVAAQRPLVVSDARTDTVLADNLAIRDLGVVAYAGMPLMDEDGTVLGSLCAIDSSPRDWTSIELAMLADLASACSSELQLRSTRRRITLAAERDRVARELSHKVTGALLQVSSHLAATRSMTAETAIDEALDQAMTSIDAVLAVVRDTVYQRLR